MQVERSTARGKLLTVCVGVVALLFACNNSIGPTATAPQPQPGLDGLTVLTPNGGETYHIGDTMRIAWDQKDTLSALVISFSNNNGRSWSPIGMVRDVEANYAHGPYSWAIDTVAMSYDGSGTSPTISDSCLIQIYDYNARTTKCDISDAVFKIRA